VGKGIRFLYFVQRPVIDIHPYRNAEHFRNKNKKFIRFHYEEVQFEYVCTLQRKDGLFVRVVCSFYSIIQPRNRFTYFRKTGAGVIRYRII
jgi:hypothetical protein